MQFTIRHYDNLLSTIDAYFSAEQGASEESVQSFVSLIGTDKAYRDNLRSEIEESFKDTEMCWKDALWDEYCHVLDASSEDQARDWIVCNVLYLIDQAEDKPA